MKRFFLSALASIPLRVLADFDQFYFSSNATSWQCEGLSFGCPAPSVCAHDALLDKYYCCGPGTGAVCWSGSQDCGGSTPGTPSSSQIGCSSGENAFCCLATREECTQRFNQVNICWAKQTNPFTNLTENDLNKTFSSLSSERPKATSYTFNLAKLTATITSSVSSATTSSSPASSSPSTTNPPTSPTPTQSQSSSSGLSGGAIGGIVVGVVLGLALIGAGCFFFWRRNSKPSHNELDGNPYSGNVNGQGAYGQPVQQEKYALHEAPHSPLTHPPVEMDATQQHPVEVEGNKPHNVA